ncbi:hypothetical protein NFHSH190041_31270 [Shewanella sp. NFH-SH190041]|uniref:efflux RND transporter permease subunit n=1 Tax=Shewanella sp. NFH-SH190041 TaxID=2950245 RepID=UPI0021C325F2|nr:MMPL family transporter [Shewanella sp. NFH-SH190041]BDM65675.1 hypothetical protein NFHSH190041_31270 [Shewanella sp. NFH-SH190041]
MQVKLARTLLNHKLERLAVCWRYPWRVLFAWLLLVCLVSPWVMQVKINSQYDAYFAEANPRYQVSKVIVEQFNRPDSLWLMLSGLPTWQWTAQSSTFERIIRGLRDTPGLQHIGGYADLYHSASNQLLLPYKPHPRADLVQSADGQAILLELVLDPAYVTPPALAQLISTIDTTLKTELESAQIQHFYYGPLALNCQYAQVLKQDLRWFAPGLLLLVALMLAWRIRCRYWSVAIGSSALLGVWLTLALAGALQLPLAAISAFIPVIVMTLSLAGGLHLYTGWQWLVQRGASPSQAMLHTVSNHLPPLFWGAVTTAGGFLLLLFSPSPPVAAFGLLVSFAVVVNLLLLLTWLPALAGFSRQVGTSSVLSSMVPSTLAAGLNTHLPAGADVREKVQVNSSENTKADSSAGFSTDIRTNLTTKVRLGVAQRLAWWCFMFPGFPALMAVVLTFFMLGGVYQIQFRDDPLGYFPPDNPLSQGASQMQQHFTSSHSFSLLVSHPQSMVSADAVAELNRLSRFIRAQPEVLRVDSLVDWLRASGMGPNRLATAFSRMSPIEVGLGRELSEDLQQSVVGIQLKSVDTATMLALEQRITHWLTEQSLTLQVSPGLGPQMLYAELSRDNAHSMLLSFLLALLLLSLLVYWLRRSLTLALLALLANLLPLIWVFGFWHYIGGGLSLGSVVVVGMILGIIVDDTLHLLLRLPLDRPVSQLCYLRRLTGITPAITLTSLTLVAGFALGCLSDFGPIHELSLLSALIIASAWCFDLLLLPRLLYWAANHQWQGVSGFTSKDSPF